MSCCVPVEGCGGPQKLQQLQKLLKLQVSFVHYSKVTTGETGKDERKRYTSINKLK